MVIRKRKYFLNEQFFDVWNQTMAYVFGFWVADGYMRISRSYRILFSSKDYEILEKIQKAMQTNAPIKIDYRFQAYELSICSKKLYQGLLALGGRQNKSTTLIFPSMPNEFLADFIRGYFDGDGSVHTISYKCSKNNKWCSQIRSNFTCGSVQFITSLRNLLTEKINVRDRVIGQYGPHQFKLGYGQMDTFKLFKYMYHSKCSISMSRKHKFLLELTHRCKKSYAR